MKRLLVCLLVICLTVHAVPARERRKGKPRPALDNPASNEAEPDNLKHIEPLLNQRPLRPSKASVQASLKPKTINRAVIKPEQPEQILINQRDPISNKANEHVSKNQNHVAPVNVEPEQHKHKRPSSKRRRPATDKASSQVNKIPKPPAPVEIEPEQLKYAEPLLNLESLTSSNDNAQITAKLKTPSPDILEPEITNTKPLSIQRNQGPNKASVQVSLKPKTPIAPAIVIPDENYEANEEPEQRKHKQPSSKRRRPATHKASSQVNKIPKPPAPVEVEPEQLKYNEPLLNLESLTSNNENAQVTGNLKTPSPDILEPKITNPKPLLIRRNQGPNKAGVQVSLKSKTPITPAIVIPDENFEANVEPEQHKHKQPSSKRRRPAAHKASSQVGKIPKPPAPVEIEPEQLKYNEPLLNLESLTSNNENAQITGNLKTPSPDILEPEITNPKPLLIRRNQGPNKAGVQVSLKPKTPVASVIPDENYELNVLTASVPPLIKAVRLEPKRKQILHPIKRPVVGPVSARIISNENEITKDGFFYSYETGNGIKSQATSKRVKLGKNTFGNQEEGSFEWTAPNHKTIHVVYTADAHGYHPIVTYQ